MRFMKKVFEKVLSMIISWVACLLIGCITAQPVIELVRKLLFDEKNQIAFTFSELVTVVIFALACFAFLLITGILIVKTINYYQFHHFNKMIPIESKAFSGKWTMYIYETESERDADYGRYAAASKKDELDVRFYSRYVYITSIRKLPIEMAGRVWNWVGYFDGQIFVGYYVREQHGGSVCLRQDANNDKKMTGYYIKYVGDIAKTQYVSLQKD